MKSIAEAFVQEKQKLDSFRISRKDFNRTF